MADPEKDKLPNEKVVTKEEYNDFTPVKNDYVIQAFTPEQEEAAYKSAESSVAFRSLLDERKNKHKDYIQRYQHAGETAKALAWSNLFTNLAKLGGWGAAPVIQEDTKPLMNAFQEADKVRNLYYQTDDAYGQALRQTRLDYVNAARATHNAIEKAKYEARQKEVDLINKANLERSGKTTTKEVYKNDPTEDLKKQKLRAEIASILARKDLSKAQKDKLIKEAEDKASGADKKPFYSYAGKDGYTYNLTKSQAQDIVTKLKQDKNNPPEGLSQQYLDKLDKDIGLLETALKYGQSDNATLAIIAEYLSSNPERFADILSRTPRTKTSLHIDEQTDDDASGSNNNLTVNNLYL